MLGFAFMYGWLSKKTYEFCWPDCLDGRFLWRQMQDFYRFEVEREEELAVVMFSTPKMEGSVALTHASPIQLN